MSGNIDTLDVNAEVKSCGTSSLDQSISPMTPYVHCLQNLNDRLASFIKNKAILESENCHLKAVLKSSKEASYREAVMRKKRYTDELAEKDKCLNEVALEKAKLELEYRKTLADNDNLKGEIQNIQKQLEDTQMKLKEEIIARVDLDNTAKTLQENLIFELHLQNEEFNMTRQEVDTSQMNGHLGDQCCNNFQLAESLQQLREQFGNEIRANRNELKSLLESKLNNERNCLYRENQSLSSALELSFVRSGNSFARIVDLEEANANLSAQIRDFEQALEVERARSAESSNELKTLGQEMESHLKKYQDLLDTKVALSMEISAFKQLLNSGEQFSSVEEPGAKRRRSEPNREVSNKCLIM